MNYEGYLFELLFRPRNVHSWNIWSIIKRFVINGCANITWNWILRRYCRNMMRLLNNMTPWYYVDIWCLMVRWTHFMFQFRWIVWKDRNKMIKFFHNIVLINNGEIVKFVWNNYYWDHEFVNIEIFSDDTHFHL